MFPSNTRPVHTQFLAFTCTYIFLGIIALFIEVPWYLKARLAFLILSGLGIYAVFYWVSEQLENL